MYFLIFQIWFYRNKEGEKKNKNKSFIQRWKDCEVELKEVNDWNKDLHQVKEVVHL